MGRASYVAVLAAAVACCAALGAVLAVLLDLVHDRAALGLAVGALGLLALRRVAPERHGAAAGLFIAFFDAGVGPGGPLVGLVARLGSPGSALAAAGVAVLLAGVMQVRAPSWKIALQPTPGGAETADGAPYGHGIRKRPE